MRRRSGLGGLGGLDGLEPCAARVTPVIAEEGIEDAGSSGRDGTGPPETG